MLSITTKIDSQKKKKQKKQKQQQQQQQTTNIKYINILKDL